MASYARVKSRINAFVSVGRSSASFIDVVPLRKMTWTFRGRRLGRDYERVRACAFDVVWTHRASGDETCEYFFVRRERHRARATRAAGV